MVLALLLLAEVVAPVELELRFLLEQFEQELAVRAVVVEPPVLLVRHRHLVYLHQAVAQAREEGRQETILLATHLSLGLQLAHVRAV